MQDAYFRRFLGRLFERSHLWETAFDNSGSITNYRLGQQDVARAIWNSLTRTQRSTIILEERDGNPV